MLGEEPSLEASPVRFCHKTLWNIPINEAIVTIENDEVLAAKIILLLYKCHVSTLRTLMQRNDYVRCRKRIAHLEDLVEELQLHSHASRVAIAVLSTALNGVVGKKLTSEMFI